MKVLDQISSHGDGNVMEDIGGWTDNFVWVLDGATGIQKKQHFSIQSDASWLVGIIDTFIRQNWIKYKSPQSILKKASEATRIEAVRMNVLNSIKSFEMPSYAIACGKVERNVLRFVVLGDCSIVIKCSKGIRVITDRAFLNNTMDNRITMPDDQNLRAMVFKTRRSTMNKVGGYAIGSIMGEAYNLFREEKVELSDVSDIIFCSDGFSRIVDKYALMSWKNIFETKLSDVLEVIRSYENSIKNFDGKRSDDIFALKVCNYD